MDAPLVPARRDELVEQIAGRLRALHLSAPAILLLQMHAPLSFLGSQLLLFAQPFAGLFAADRLSRDLALFLEDQENVERLIERLEIESPPGS